MNVSLTVSDNIDELEQNHELSLWSKVQSYETIFIIDVDNISVGYIAYQNTNNTITKFEVVESYRNSGIGTIAMQKFLKKMKPYTDRVILHPISVSLCEYYKRFGFRKRILNEHKMILKF